MALYLTFFVLFICATFNKDTWTSADQELEPDPTFKVVGGDEADIKDYPYMAYLMLWDGKNYYDCGGSIISKHYILTAAHCLKQATKAVIRIGSSSSISDGEVYESASLSVHPKYDEYEIDFDVGLIFVREAMALDGVSSKPVGLIRSGRTIPDSTLLNVTGWGKSEEDGNVNEILRATQIPTITNSACRNKLNMFISSRMFCAGLDEGGKDSCQGDSGGPVVSNNIQVGLVSFGIGCARANTPGVYTNLGHPAIRLWIKFHAGV